MLLYAAQWSLPFQFAVSQGPHILVKHIAVKIRFVLIFIEGAGNVFIRLTDVFHQTHYSLNVKGV